ncbi:MAG: hypothetical protein IPM16_19225 [Chloroflexi bacterium]|nr:hypothetical protein [Chloroflexota bacterium]
MSFQLGSRFTYNSDGSLIAGVPRSNDSVVEVWNTETFDVVTTLSGHTSWIAAISWATNTTLATVSDDETTRIWDAQTGQQLDVLDTGYTSTPDFSPDGSLFAAAAIDQVNVIREVIGGDVLAALGSTTTPIADAGPIRLSPTAVTMALSG